MVFFELLLPETCQPGAVWTAVDVLRELNLLARVRNPRRSTPAVAWRLVDGAGKTHPLNRHSFRSDAEARFSRRPGAVTKALVIPPLEMPSLPVLRQRVQRSGKTVALIRERFEGGALMAACGTGVWLLAQAGCIDRAPIPWLYRSGFEESYPAVQVETQQPLLSGNRWACASVPAWMPMLVLRLAALAGLAELAHAAGEKFLINAEREALAAAMTSGQVMGRSRDVPLYKAQTWIQDNASRPIGVRDVAQAAAISERTLGRLFQQHLGQTPASFMREVRIKRAQMWLEGTWRTVEEIARDCGYDDTSAFCRMFKRTVGTSPKRYRERLTLRGPRALWRAGESEASRPAPTMSLKPDHR